MFSYWYLFALLLAVVVELGGGGGEGATGGLRRGGGAASLFLLLMLGQYKTSLLGCHRKFVHFLLHLAAILLDKHAARFWSVLSIFAKGRLANRKLLRPQGATTAHTPHPPPPATLHPPYPCQLSSCKSNVPVLMSESKRRVTFPSCRHSLGCTFQ